MRTYTIEYSIYRGFENTTQGNTTVEALNERDAYAQAKGFLSEHSDIDLIKEV